MEAFDRAQIVLTYAEGLLKKLCELGFDDWDIKPDQIEYMFTNLMMCLIHDFLLNEFKIDSFHLITDDELISFKEICNVMVDKIK